ncbi:MAG: Re/Si-specific NAD(P)(+) transhydrogenase subunit alpha [Alphaproteobacteria bacterium]
MKLAVLKERHEGETRVAATPDTVKKLTALGFDVVIESGAGLGSSFMDGAYEEVGATIVANADDALDNADVIFKIRRPTDDELGKIKKGAKVIASLNPYQDAEGLKAYAAAGIEAYAMELMPRITRAQSMDILSSQSNLSGYKSVLVAANEYGRGFPMMMTAAGTVAPARVMVFGAGVAGLQAIATAKRLGAIVSATDVRAAAAEQVESLGGEFVMVESEETEDAETAGGYAKEMSDEYKAKQAELIAKTLTKQDIAITTALIPGRAAPTLITKEHIASMKPGSVIVDLAVEQGGNVEGSVAGENVVTENGVTIVGPINMPGQLAADASSLFAKNLLNFLSAFMDEENGGLAIDYEDEVITGILLTRDGAIVHPNFAGGSE